MINLLGCKDRLHKGAPSRCCDVSPVPQSEHSRHVFKELKISPLRAFLANPVKPHLVNFVYGRLHFFFAVPRGLQWNRRV